MTKNIRYIFTFLAAAYFLFAGCGYNIAKYCCYGCESKHQNSSESAAHCEKKQHEPKNDCCKFKEPIQKKIHSCKAFNQHASKCFFMRINTDIPTIVTGNIIDNKSVHCIDLFYLSMQEVNKKYKSVSERVYSPPDNFVNFTGREILVKKAVLLI